MVNKTDIKYAASLAYLTIYPGTTMHSTVAGKSSFVLKHQPRSVLYYVKGETDGMASVVWGTYVRPKTATAPISWSRTLLNASSNQPGYVNIEENVPPSSIYPKLNVEKNHSKILLETQILCFDTNNTREIFGFHLVNPHRIRDGAYFSSVVTFTPNNGFSANNAPP